MSLAEELKNRGFINQFSAPTVSEIIDGAPLVVYHGIDPSADSAHAGNFVNWMLLRHLKQAGHKIIFLVGGGTGMIGDPKSDVERPLSDANEVALRVEKLKKQAELLFADPEIEFVNNSQWLMKAELIPFLRDIGKHFTVNELIKKDAISKRLEGENGISYTEFAYPLLQAYDYLTLYRSHGCNLQVGGSDQWGNIIAGVDLIRRVEKASVHALTVPLIVDKTTGKKFGKSEGNAVWLDPEKTSPYQFYQFWLNTTDENIVDYLKLFTFLSLAEIANIEKDFALNPGSRAAQKILASAVTTIVHGEMTATTVAVVSELLFGDATLETLTDEQKLVITKNAPLYQLKEEMPLTEVLVASGLATSKREARTFIESGAISYNGQKITATDWTLSLEKAVNGVGILKRGRKQLSVIVM
jgi:tyrosyl-tRNA synthetase